MSEVARQQIDLASMRMMTMASAGRASLVDHVNFGRDDLPISRMANPVQRMVAYITPDDLDPLIRREFFPPTGKTAPIAHLIQDAAMAETRTWVPVLPDDMAKLGADHLESVIREFAASTETETEPFQIIGILAVQKNLHTVFATSRSFFDSLVSSVSEDEPSEGEPLDEEELRDVYTHMSERVDDIPPYTEWRAGYEDWVVLEKPIKDRRTAAGLVAMLMLPEQQIHPVIRQRLLEPSDA